MTELNDRPEGACMRIPGKENAYRVRGRIFTYICILSPTGEDDSCSCLDWLHRRARACTPCRHLRYLARWLQMTLCPYCAEGGCSACGGLGRIPVASATDEELRRIFA